MEGALFCHRCGKAQRDLLAAEPVEADPAPAEIAEASNTTSAAPVPPAPRVLPVSFGNSVAVRVGFLAASVASMLDALPWVDMLFVVWSAAAGYVSVVLYRKRTGQALSVRGGAKMGWITGVLNAVIVIVFITLTFVASISDFTATYRQQLGALQARDPASYAKASGFLESPYALATGVIVLLFAMFVVFTTAGIAGGALSAKMGKKD